VEVEVEVEGLVISFYASIILPGAAGKPTQQAA
jgi:hypothetical protein